MNPHAIVGAILCLMWGCACQTNPVAAPAVSTKSPAADGRSSADGFRIGRAQLESGDHAAAIKQFARLRDHAREAGERDRAVLGLSMALQDSGNRGAALGVLEPLPLTPKTEIDARKCVLAGELHLHQKNFDLARVWLSRGLEVEPESRSPYRATALFNLGKTLLAEDKLELAQTAFEAAGDLFASNGDETNARQCEAIATGIARALL